MTRKVNLKEWISVDVRLPKKGQKAFICDANWDGLADYELPVVFNGKDFRMDKFGVVCGATYWQLRQEKI